MLLSLLFLLLLVVVVKVLVLAVVVVAVVTAEVVAVAVEVVEVVIAVVAATLPKHQLDIARCHLPIIGIASEVSGTLPATNNKNTEMATRMETPRDTFSPLSAGNRKTISSTPDSIRHGSSM